MKKYLYIFILLLAATTLATVSCNREDDLDEIFVGKTWYMVGGCLNGQPLNTEVKNFYNYGESAYLLNFQSGTFSGTLSTGVQFSGTWRAVAKSRTITLTLTNGANCTIPFDRNVYTVIKGITYYKGDNQVLLIHADENNYLRLSNSRSPVVSQ